MTRFDQYIGLTKGAEEFLDYIQEKYNCEKLEFVLVPPEQTLCSVYGIEGQIVRMYYGDDDKVNEYFEFKEEIQHEPWSSGPMYFTHLRRFLKKRSGQTLDMGPSFSWVNVPLYAIEKNIQNEFDQDKGEIYI